MILRCNSTLRNECGFVFLNNFDQCRVAKAMCQELDLEVANNITELQTLLRKLSDLIRGNRFLLVLNDVWSEDSTMWEPFKSALENGAR